MYIKKVIIQNFKCFQLFELDLKKDINIIVGDNEAGKSTILEAVNLALTGILHGRYLKYETLSQYLFNHTAIEEWQKNKDILPSILIEIYFDNEDKNPDIANFKGTNNSKHENEYGLSFSIMFNEEYREEYNAYIKQDKDINTLPIEYYDKISWRSFADASITARSIPIKSALIDSANSRYQDGSDIYINRIIKDGLESEQKIQISQAHRSMKNGFQNTINNMKPISDNEKVKICVNLKTQNAWEEDLITHIDNTPFHYIGKGQQCITKTELFLCSKKGQDAGVILLEEPENHLSHSKLNTLISCITNQGNSDNNKQIIISTHSSFVANKLNLENLILLNKDKDNQRKIFPLKNLKEEDNLKKTFKFFQKLPGYDTLRLLLCKSAILVEGDSDELIIQKAYFSLYQKLPIADEIEVISVGTGFKNFLTIASKIGKRVAIATDNDGNIDAITEKYKDYTSLQDIKVCYDDKIYKCDTEEYNIDVNRKSGFNCNTLEPCIVRSNNNDIELFKKIFGTNFLDLKAIHKYMYDNKTECALQIFESVEKIEFPQYILDAIKYAKGEK